MIQKSSNIGAAKIALTLPPEDRWRLLTAPASASRRRSASPAPPPAGCALIKKWKPIEHATTSYGHGFSVSLLQMARSYTIFAGNGELLPARIFRTEDEQRGRPMQVSLRSR